MLSLLPESHSLASIHESMFPQCRENCQNRVAGLGVDHRAAIGVLDRLGTRADHLLAIDDQPSIGLADMLGAFRKQRESVAFAHPCPHSLSRRDEAPARIPARNG